MTPPMFPLGLDGLDEASPEGAASLFSLDLAGDAGAGLDAEGLVLERVGGARAPRAFGDASDPSVEAMASRMRARLVARRAIRELASAARREHARREATADRHAARRLPAAGFRAFVIAAAAARARGVAARLALARARTPRVWFSVWTRLRRNRALLRRVFASCLEAWATLERREGAGVSPSLAKTRAFARKALAVWGARARLRRAGREDRKKARRAASFRATRLVREGAFRPWRVLASRRAAFSAWSRVAAHRSAVRSTFAPFRARVAARVRRRVLFAWRRFASTATRGAAMRSRALATFLRPFAFAWRAWALKRAADRVFAASAVAAHERNGLYRAWRAWALGGACANLTAGAPTPTRSVRGEASDATRGEPAGATETETTPGGDELLSGGGQSVREAARFAIARGARVALARRSAFAAWRDAAARSAREAREAAAADREANASRVARAAERAAAAGNRRAIRRGEARGDGAASGAEDPRRAGGGFGGRFGFGSGTAAVENRGSVENRRGGNRRGGGSGSPRAARRDGVPTRPAPLERVETLAAAAAAAAAKGRRLPSGGGSWTARDEADADLAGIRGEARVSVGAADRARASSETSEVPAVAAADPELVAKLVAARREWARRTGVASDGYGS